jgi:hypothetical protein
MSVLRFHRSPKFFSARSGDIAQLQFPIQTRAAIARVCTRVARWFVFEPKISIWENFSGPRIRKLWYILRPLGTFYGHFGYFMTIVSLFGTFFPVLVSCIKKNLAALVCTKETQTETFFHKNFFPNLRLHVHMYVIQQSRNINQPPSRLSGP